MGQCSKEETRHSALACASERAKGRRQRERTRAKGNIFFPSAFTPTPFVRPYMLPAITGRELKSMELIHEREHMVARDGQRIIWK